MNYTRSGHNVRKKKIIYLPPEILLMNLQIKWEYDYTGLIPEGNTIESPPLEIIKKGNDAIRAYFDSLEGEKNPLSETKIILVGDGEAGKTSVVKQLSMSLLTRTSPPPTPPQ